MAELNKIVEFLDGVFEKLDGDYSNNGLQVDGKQDVKKIVFAVDGCLEVFEKVVESGADMVIVHHGISWADSLKRITNINYGRVSKLIKNDVSLYAQHLPLDKHPEYGNNIQLAKMFEIKNIKEFGEYNGNNIGFCGELESEIEIDEFVGLIDDRLSTKSLVLKFGKDKIRTIGFISGGGSKLLPEAVDLDLDCYVTGEPIHSAYHDAKEGNINVVFAGHYQTETLGVKALMPLLKEKFGVEVEFIDVLTTI